MEVDQAYIVSVLDLRDICKELTHGKFQYTVAEVSDDDITVAYNEGEDDLNPSSFTFPIIRDLSLPILPRTEDCLMVCLHVYTHRQTQHRMYMEDGKIKMDGITDWLRFWAPMDAVLLKMTTIPGLI